MFFQVLFQPIAYCRTRTHTEHSFLGERLKTTHSQLFLTYAARLHTFCLVDGARVGLKTKHLEFDLKSKAIIHEIKFKD